MSLPPNLARMLAGRLSVPVIASPLFIISNPDLVIAQCIAGVVGSFPALNARPAPVLADWIERIQDALATHDAVTRTGCRPPSPSTRSCTAATRGSRRISRLACASRCRS